MSRKCVPALPTIGACLISCFLCRSGRAQPTFQGLGDLPGGDFYSEANAVSGDGTVVFGSSNAGDIHGLRAFRWERAAGMVALPLAVFPWVGGSQGRATNADGSVLVGSANIFDSTTPFLGRAFRWQEETGVTLLFDPADDLPTNSGALSVSGDGSIVVGGMELDKITAAFGAFYWTEATGVVHLGLLPGSPPSGTSLAEAISANGLVIAGRATSATPDGVEAFLWTQETGMTPCGDLVGGPLYSSFLALSQDGSVAAGIGSSVLSQNPFRFEALRYTAKDGMIGLGDLPGGTFDSWALAISGDGSVIVGSGDTDIGRAAFIWDAEHGMRNLQQVLIDEYGLGSQLSGWILRRARGISADGRTIVGVGRNPQGRSEAWVATLGGDLPDVEAGEVEVAPSCPADFDRDAIVNVQDLLAFLDAFIALSPAADFNRDKLLNSQDFFDFLAAFFVGCG
jgi:probable HAF family extracellular repeat protein